MKSILFSIILIALLTACGSSDNDKTSSELIKLNLKEVAVFADDEDWMLSRINQVQLDSQKNIFFTDMSQRQIYVLSPEGDLIDRIGSEGSGPGEFQGLGAVLLINDNRLLATDFNNRRVSDFSLTDGKWAYSGLFNVDNNASFFVGQLFKLHTGELLVNNPLAFGREGMPEMDRVTYRNNSYAKIDQNGEILVETFMETKGMPLYMSQNEGRFSVAMISFMELELMTVSPAGYIYLANNMEAKVIKRNADFEEVAVFEFEAGRYPVTTQEMENALANYEGSFRNTIRGLIPEIKPVISRIVISDSGEVWVNVYGKEHNRGWIVINEDGTVRGEVEFPDQTTVHQIRGNQIYTVQLDEFDIPRIVIFEVN